MRATPGEWDCLRLAAKAEDREEAAEKLRPAFEERMRELGYPPLAIAHAFSTLTGPDTVEKALAELEESARLERIVPVPLDFEEVEREPRLVVGHSLTTTAVERDGRGIHIMYEIRPGLSSWAPRPRIEVRDERDREYAYTGGGFVGLGGDSGRTTIGGFALPLPHQHASLLRVRMSWSTDSTSLWERPAHELRITL